MDRRENLRRIVELSKLMVDAGLIGLAAFISPYREDREYVRSRFNGDNFLEIYIRCSVEECERRDPKGNYKKAKAGIIREYTGISAPYEEPENPDLVIDTEKINLETSVQKILTLLDKKNFISLSESSNILLLPIIYSNNKLIMKATAMGRLLGSEEFVRSIPVASLMSLSQAAKTACLFCDTGLPSQSWTVS